LAIILAVCAALGSPAGRPDVARPPILIGVSNAQSGPSGFLGRHLLAGSRAYFDQVNRAGGIHGRKVELVVKDDRYEPEPAVQNTYELINRHHVFFLFDYVGTPTLTRILPLLRYYQPETIINVAPFTGAEPQRRPPYDRFVFNIRASYFDETKALVSYLHAHGARKIGFLGQADAYGKSGEIGVREALSDRGLKISGITTYRRNESFHTNMVEQVSILRDAGADAVIAVGVYGPCAAFVRDARVSGWDAPIAFVSFAGADALLQILAGNSKEAGMDLTGNLIASQVVPSPDQVQYPLVERFQKSAPLEDRGFISLEGWLNAAVAVEALTRMGSDESRSGFVRAMESLGGWDPGMGFRLEFSRERHQATHRVWLVRTRERRWSQIATN